MITSIDVGFRMARKAKKGRKKDEKRRKKGKNDGKKDKNEDRGKGWGLQNRNQILPNQNIPYGMQTAQNHQMPYGNNPVQQSNIRQQRNMSNVSYINMPTDQYGNPIRNLTQYDQFGNPTGDGRLSAQYNQYGNSNYPQNEIPINQLADEKQRQALAMYYY